MGNSIRLALSAIAVMTIALVAGGKPLHAANADAQNVLQAVQVITAKSDTSTVKAPTANGKRARDAAFDRPSGLEARSS